MKDLSTICHMQQQFLTLKNFKNADANKMQQNLFILSMSVTSNMYRLDYDDFLHNYNFTTNTHI